MRASIGCGVWWRRRPRRRRRRQLHLFDVGRSLDGDGVACFGFVQREGAKQGLRAPRRIAWAKLLARVFEIDVTKCGCGGRLRIVETVTSAKRMTELLEGPRGPPRVRPVVPSGRALVWMPRDSTHRLASSRTHQ